MMRIRLFATLTGLGLLGAGAVAAQDAPPPGCRWQGYQGDTVLACKDGKGHWRRSGDDMIVGTYPLPKPKPKPVAAAKPASPPAPAATASATTADDAGTPALAQGEALPADEAAAPAASDAAVDAAAAPPEPVVAEPAPEPPAKAPWWKGIWEAILNFLRMVGLLR